MIARYLKWCFANAPQLLTTFFKPEIPFISLRIIHLRIVVRLNLSYYDKGVSQTYFPQRQVKTIIA
jgi:hypothetical protein